MGGSAIKTGKTASEPNEDGVVFPYTKWYKKLLCFYKLDAAGYIQMKDGKKSLNWIKIAGTVTGVGAVVYVLNRKFRWF